MTWFVYAAGGVALAAAAWGLHRLARWAAGRGWIYYGNRRGPAPWLGCLDQIYEPEIVHVVEEEASRRISADQAESGDEPWW